MASDESEKQWAQEQIAASDQIYQCFARINGIPGRLGEIEN